MFIKHIYESSTSLFSLESVFAGGHVDKKYSIVTCFQFNSAWTIILDCENTPTLRNGRVQGRYTLGPSTSEHVVAMWNLMQRNEAECDGNPKFLFRLTLAGTFFSYFKKTAFTEGVGYICWKAPQGKLVSWVHICFFTEEQAIFWGRSGEPAGGGGKLREQNAPNAVLVCGILAPLRKPPFCLPVYYFRGCLCARRLSV